MSKADLDKLVAFPTGIVSSHSSHGDDTAVVSKTASKMSATPVGATRRALTSRECDGGRLFLGASRASR